MNFSLKQNLYLRFRIRTDGKIETASSWFTLVNLHSVIRNILQTEVSEISRNSRPLVDVASSYFSYTPLNVDRSAVILLN